MIDKILAAAADAYNPLLLIISIGLAIRCWIKRDKYSAVEFFILVIIAYGLMFFDLQFNVWSTFGGDFSTHTATSIVMIVFIGSSCSKPLHISLWISFLIYAVVMIHLGYHTWLDIFTTGALVFVIAKIIDYGFNRVRIRK